MQLNGNVLGIDIGSVSISIVEITPQREIVKNAYHIHHGKIRDTLLKILNQFEFSQLSAFAATSSTPFTIQVNRRYDNQVAIITTANHFYGKVGSILLVGGEKFGLLLFDNNGNYLNYKTNTSCAAGTGSFLDQQAGRLNLNGIGELSEIALENHKEIPKIASRCAVFAKTDLIHAQQEGYTLDQICDGLCFGLAKNIVDTLFKNIKPNDPILFIGGVSRNKAVAQHISSLIAADVIVDDMSHLYGAVGAAISMIEDKDEIENLEIRHPEDLIQFTHKQNPSYYDPLVLKLSSYPDFNGLKRYNYSVKIKKAINFVEVDIYKKISHSKAVEVYLGIDVGSTSTKAILIEKNNTVIAGFYTRTVGSPVEATQAIFESIDDMIKMYQIQLSIIGVGTTGSGRKFVGKIIAADLIIDEITSHARAAYELNPEVDTIIEIGGQDSKFTTLKNGMVTSSTMNHVCAAGTGSFIEEQAQKLSCPLSEYSERSKNVKSPMSSDRCTVFMERDINHYLSEGYTIDESLASVLHSVRENYLTKVANEANIGNTIFFQGATAKNKALVAAFEQKLNKPILVSKYCHLTGALGTALTLLDEGTQTSNFRGLDLYQKDIPIHSEICELCTNHCKISIANIGKENVAYGFLCGRDYETKKFVDKNKSGFDLNVVRKSAFSFKPQKEYLYPFTIGIPVGLYLFEDFPFWLNFFNLLSIKTISSKNFKNAVKEGKTVTGAEFCAPMTAMHGHVKYLMNKADYIFVPFYLENNEKEKGVRRQYCYYSQFMPALISGLGGNYKHRILKPIVKYLQNVFFTKVQLYNMLKSISDGGISLFEVSSAYDKALELKNSAYNQLKDFFKKELAQLNDIGVVFVGRAYTILSPSMNKEIPHIFNTLGIKTFFQDMLSYSKDDVMEIRPLLDELHWEHASKILEAAEVIAKTKGIYPVFVTSFKCSPDSFVMDYFKDVMEQNRKPYLILQLDEHDSNVGYETRIEAAIRSFRNHYNAIKPKKTFVTPIIKPEKEKTLLGKTIILPNWDDITCRFLVANLRAEGYDARLLEETQASIRTSLKYNSGQCIPLNIIAQDYINYVIKHDLNPEKTVLWLNDSELACNIKLYPYHIKRILTSYGKGLEKANVYAGELSFIDISVKASMNAYFSHMFGGMLRKMACKTRPYETEPGTTQKVLNKSIQMLTEAFEKKRSKEGTVADIVSHFDWIDTQVETRPKVAIFGDLYVRDNEVLNQNLIDFIEKNNGEVITTPFNHFARIIAGTYFRKWFIEGKYFDMIATKTMLTTMVQLEKTYNKHFERILGKLDHKFKESPEKILSEYDISIENFGESTDNILKIFYIKKQHPDVSLFVQTSPYFCCPSLVTEAMSKEIEKNTGVPVVSITYDGTGGNQNNIIIPYLKYPRQH